MFTEIGCFDGQFLWQVKESRKTYQVPPRCISYTLQKQFKKELEQIQSQDIITPLHVDETEVIQQFQTGTKTKWKAEPLS